MIVNFMSYLTEAINVCTEITTIKIILNGLSIKQISIPNNDTYYSETKQSKGIPSLESNTYLTEE